MSRAYPLSFSKFTLFSVTGRQRLLLLLLLLLLLSHTMLSTPAWSQTESPQMNLPRTVLSAGMHRMDVQIAQTETARSTGLMHRKEMPTHEGMLFVFERPGVQCFWMKNTLLPLSIAFIADDGTIVNLDDMKPKTLDSHCSAKPVRFVLEMNQGWFEKRGIQAGFKLQGTPFKP